MFCVAQDTSFSKARGVQRLDAAALTGGGQPGKPWAGELEAECSHSVSLEHI